MIYKELVTNYLKHSKKYGLFLRVIINRTVFPLRGMSVTSGTDGTRYDGDSPLFGQELFDLHPIEEGFGAKDLDFVDGGIYGTDLMLTISSLPR